MLFEVLANDVVIGHSRFEGRDASMGVAGGVFLPSPAYAHVQQSVRDARDGSRGHLGLAVHPVGGSVIPCDGPVVLVDYSEELTEDGLFVEIMGVGHPLYAELFPGT